MITKRKSALLAGVALLIMAITAAFTFGYVHNTLVVPGNSESTVKNLKSNEFLFMLEIVGWHIILLCDVVVAWALYLFFKNENKKLSAFTAGFRFVYSAILGVAILHLIYVLKILNGTFDVVSGIVDQEIMFHLNWFENLWSAGLILFGFHLLLLGILAIKSKYIHYIWGIILVPTALSYIVVHSGFTFFPEFESQFKALESILGLPMALGEISFAVLLVILGRKSKTRLRNYKNNLLSQASHGTSN